MTSNWAPARSGGSAAWPSGTRSAFSPGFAAALRRRRRPRPRPRRPATGSGFVFQIVNAELAGLDAEFDFPGAWGLLLRDIHAPASLLLEGAFVGWDLQKLVARKGGYLRILDDVLPFDHVEVARVATTREWPDNIFLDVAAARTGRSTLTAQGDVHRHLRVRAEARRSSECASGIDMHAEFSDAAPALAAVAGPAGHPRADRGRRRCPRSARPAATPSSA